MHRLLALALALGPSEIPGPTEEPLAPEPQEDPAARAARHFSAGEFIEAAEAFEDAFVETGDPAFVFGRAQALRRAGNCAAAIEEFERFIALGPPPSDVQEAQTVIDACERVLGIGEAPEPTSAPVVEPPPDDRRAPTKRRRWYADPAGDALFASGLLVAGLGGGLFGGSFARARDRSGETESEYERRDRSVRAMSISGLVLLGVGGALLVGSIVRFAVVARRDRTTALQLDDARRPFVVRPSFTPRGLPSPRLEAR